MPKSKSGLVSYEYKPTSPAAHLAFGGKTIVIRAKNKYEADKKAALRVAKYKFGHTQSIYTEQKSGRARGRKTFF